MAHDDEELDPTPAEPEFFDDHIASRAVAYTQMVRAAMELRERGEKFDDLYDETMRMLQALRRSFKTLPTGEVQQIK